MVTKVDGTFTNAAIRIVTLIILCMSLAFFTPGYRAGRREVAFNLAIDREREMLHELRGDILVRTDRMIVDLFLLAELARINSPDDAFAVFMEWENIYDQIRILDAEGFELLRVNADFPGAYITPKEDLQDKGDRYYFIEGTRTPTGQVYFSPLDLNVEHGEIEQPIKPMIRAVLPFIPEAGASHGNETSSVTGSTDREYLILNYRAEHILDAIVEMQENRAIGSLAMVNHQGYYFIGEPQGRNWGFMYSELEDITMRNTHPGLIDESMAQDPYIERDADSAIIMLRVEPLSGTEAQEILRGIREAGQDMLIIHSGYHWHLFSVVDIDNAIPAAVPGITGLPVFIEIIIIAMLLGLLSWYLSSAIIRVMNAG